MNRTHGELFFMMALSVALLLVGTDVARSQSQSRGSGVRSFGPPRTAPAPGPAAAAPSTARPMGGPTADPPQLQNSRAIQGAPKSGTAPSAGAPSSGRMSRPVPRTYAAPRAASPTSGTSIPLSGSATRSRDSARFYYSASSFVNAEGQRVTRIWTDNTGIFSIRAQLIDVTGAVVRLRKSSGQEIKVPLRRLGYLDRQYVRAYAEFMAAKPG